MNVTLTVSFLMAALTFGGALVFSPVDDPLQQEQERADREHPSVDTAEPRIAWRRGVGSGSKLEPELQAVRDQLLQGWHTRDSRHAFSRVAPRYNYYANLAFDPSASGLQPYYLCKLELKIWLKPAQAFAVQFDRETNEAKIFADGQWRGYADWKLAKIAELDGQFEKGSKSVKGKKQTARG